MPARGIKATAAVTFFEAKQFLPQFNFYVDKKIKWVFYLQILKFK